MANQDWSDIGNNISDAVQKAIESEDFSKLSQSIQTMVNVAVSSAADGVARGMSSASDSLNRMADSMSRRKQPVARAQNPWKGNGKFERKTVNYMAARDISAGNLYSNGGSTRIGGYILAFLGAMGCFGFGLGMLIPAIVDGMTGLDMSFPIAVQLPFLAISAAALWKGLSVLGRIRRFKSYVRALGTRTCISIQELAGATGRNENVVLRDIRRMIERGMFRQGHMDLSGRNLFVTDQGYEAYLQDQRRMEEKRTAELAQEQAKTAYRSNSAIPDDVKKLIEEGRGYIEQIHAGNEAIKDEAVSKKLDDLETVVTKIFQYVEQNPQSASETKKLMRYYLPTTIKLLNSYQKLSDQPVQGENITKSRQEIEAALDTLNQAFARLFDNLYQSTSMDITADISVLNTLLAQEGLSGETLDKYKLYNQSGGEKNG